jgi:hypothetical protein
MSASGSSSAALTPCGICAGTITTFPPPTHDQLFVADREGGRARLDDEHLRIGMKVQGRALATPFST